MFIRIGEIELKPPLDFIEPDGGLTVYYKALEGVDDSEAKKLLAMQDSTQSVEWKDEAGVEHPARIMWLHAVEAHSEKSPDGKKITYYTFALKEV